MNESAQRKSGAILSYVSIGVNTLIQLLYTPFLIRMLGQSEYGLYSLVASIIGYLTIMDLGFGNAIIVYTAKYRAQGRIEDEKKLHGMFKLVFIVIGIITALLGIVLYFLVDRIFNATMTDTEIHKMKIMMLILSFNLMITFSFNIYTSIISAYEKFIFKKVMAIANSLLKPIMMIPLLFLGYKSIAMSIVITLVNVFISLSNYIYCKRKLHVTTKFMGFDKAVFKIVLGYSIWIFIGTIVDKVNWSVDNFILGAVSGTIAVSVYAIAATLNQMFINLSTAISAILLPKISKLVAQNTSSDELTNEMIKVGRLQNYIIFLMCTGLIIFGKEFILLWAGPNFEESYYVALFLIIPLCIPLIQNLGLSIMQAMNKYRFKSISTAIMAIFNVLISIFLAKRLGATGAAIGTAISLIICNIIIINIYYYKILNINVLKFWKNILRQSIPFVIPIIIIVIAKYLVYYNNIICFFIYCGIYTILFTIIAYFMSTNEYEKRIIDNILIKFHLKKVNKKYEKNS